MALVWTLVAIFALPVVWVAVVWVVRGSIRRRAVWAGESHASLPPDQLTPAEAGALIQGGAVDEQHLLATIIDLVDRGTIHVSGTDIDAVVLEIGSTETLRRHEVVAAQLVDHIICQGATRLVDLGLAMGSTSGVLDHWKRFQLAVQYQLRKEGLVHKRLALFTLIAVYIGMQLVFALDITGSGPVVNWGIKLFLVGVNLGAAAYILGGGIAPTVWTRVGVGRAKSWVEFRRYLRDFTRLHDAVYLERHLYGRLQADALALGLADTTVAQFGLPALKRPILDIAGRVRDMKAGFAMATTPSEPRAQFRPIFVAPHGAYEWDDGKWREIAGVKSPDTGVTDPQQSGTSVADPHDDPGREIEGPFIPDGTASSGGEGQPVLMTVDQLHSMGMSGADAHLRSAGFPGSDRARLLGVLFP